MNINQSLTKVQYITEEDFNRILPDSIYGEKIDKEDLFEDLKECVSMLQEKWNDVVDGFWFISEPAMDGGIQAAVRVKTSDYDKFRLHGDIGDLLHHEMLYCFSYGKGEPAYTVAILEECISKGSIYTLFNNDVERKE